MLNAVSQTKIANSNIHHLRRGKQWISTEMRNVEPHGRNFERQRKGLKLKVARERHEENKGKEKRLKPGEKK